MYLIFDTETTGLPKKYEAPYTDTENWTRCVQIAWQIHDDMGRVVEHEDFLIRPDGFNIPYEAEQVHGISTALAKEKGVDILQMLDKFEEALQKVKFVIGHNLNFDFNIMGAEYTRAGRSFPLEGKKILDTCTEQTAELVQLPGGRGGRYKLPKLDELHNFLFEESFAEAHNATADVEATARCFLELIRQDVFTPEEIEKGVEYFREFKEINPKPIEKIGLTHLNLKAESQKIAAKGEKVEDIIEVNEEALERLKTASFAHLHNHSQFSILQSTSSISQLIDTALKHEMPAVALTDHGNMMGAYNFVTGIISKNGDLKEGDPGFLKPIVGCELNVCEDRFNKSVKDNGYSVVFLAKNINGYRNLTKMSSLAYTEGFYYVPRIDKALVEQYKEDIIVLSGSLSGEVSGKLLNVGYNQAEEALLWWKEQFGDDFYLEVMRHNQEDENRVNVDIIKLSRKHNVKVVATNNTYYTEEKDAHAHDILLCVKDGEKLSTPKGRGRGYRFGFPNQEYYFKSSEEMKALFEDFPEAILNIQEVIDKVEVYSLRRDVLLPKFNIPSEFVSPEDETDGGKRGENAYLRHLTYEGAKARYDELTEEICTRLDFELDTIERTGYPGYFLIVQDFIAEARRMEVSVGPGRGSAAGSAVAYCLGITNVDPLEYDLLFERFLNPDRISMPDIDIDFDDEGRSKVIEYVIDKYGSSQVAQIMTYGTMAAKSSIRDTARVLDLPLSDANEIAKLIPGMKLSKIFSSPENDLKKKLRSEEFEAVKRLRSLSESAGPQAETIKQAQVLEGSVRNTGIHACGVIITPDDITKFVPVALAKDSDLYVTQFDNSVVESVGLLKMDFLGLKTLTLIKDTVENVRLRHNIVLNPDEFPKDDEKTYELFQRGETVGIFQYESPGMQKYMKELKPTTFADLIAMNALYRPGPMEYIPSFIRRKHGLEEIAYDLEACEEYLAETYGITVYQEQVMLLSQKLADFSKGDADNLRKAMGKKLIVELEKMKPKFMNQAMANGHPKETLEKIWKDWEAFASYAFNKSHSTCYAWVAYQTAYLKANYPAEYMAAVLSNNMNDIKQVTFFMEECRRMGLQVLGPDVNESHYKFTVNDEGAIRFGMGAVKGVGANAVDTIVKNREESLYKSVFDLMKRVDLRAANRKAFESLVYAGGFDCFANTHRAQYLHVDGEQTTGLEKALRFAHRFQENKNSAQASLFGGGSNAELPEPVLAPCPPWALLEKLKYEKDVIGIYLTSHPLDNYAFEMQHFCPNKIADLALVDRIKETIVDDEVKMKFSRIANRELTMGGMISVASHRFTKNGNPFGTFIIEDYTDSYEIALFGEKYLRFKEYLEEGYFIHMTGIIQERFRQAGNWNFEVTNMQLLTDLKDKLAKSLTLQLPLHAINDDFIDRLERLIAKTEIEDILPTCQLRFQIVDVEDEVFVEMPAKQRKINITQEFINEVNNSENLKYKLN